MAGTFLCKRSAGWLLEEVSLAHAQTRINLNAARASPVLWPTSSK